MHVTIVDADVGIATWDDRPPLTTAAVQEHDLVFYHLYHLLPVYQLVLKL